jgi:hypothetical protein
MNSDTPEPSRARAALAALLLFWFGLAAAPTLLARSVYATVLDPQTHHNMLDRLNVASRVRPALLQWGAARFFASAQGGQAPPNVRLLSANAWAIMATGLLPEDWLAVQMHNLIDAWFDWLSGDEPLPAARVELGPVAERLRSPNGALALVALLENTRACNPNEVVVAGDAPLGAYAVFMPCIPPGTNLASLAEASATYTADVLPQEIDLPFLIGAGILSPDAGPQLDQLRFGIRWVEAMLRLWGWVCLLLLALFLLLTVRTWRDLAEMPIAPLGMAGGTSLVLAVILFGVGSWSTGPALAWLDGALWPEAGSLAREVAAYVVRAAALRLAAWGGALILVGLAVWGIGWLVRRRGDRPARKAEPQRPSRTRRQFM